MTRIRGARRRNFFIVGSITQGLQVFAFYGIINRLKAQIMPTLQKQKQIAKKMIQRSVMLSDEKKEKWMERLEELDEAQLGELVARLMKEPIFLKRAAKDSLSEDEEAFSGFKQLLKKSKKKVRVFEESHHVKQDEEHLESLEEELKNL